MRRILGFDSRVEDYSLDPKWCVVNRDRLGDGWCALMLAGRTNTASSLPAIYWYAGVRDIPLIGITTQAKAWYPLPRGAGDQQEAIFGIPRSIKTIEMVLSEIKRRWKISKDRVILVGYSAGAVMAIQVAAHSKEPFAGVIVHAGAILEPHTLPRCRCSETPFLLTHARNDETFDWFERYLPMKNVMKKRKYNVSACESPWGGHGVSDYDLLMSRLFMKRCQRRGDPVFLR